MRRPRTSSTVHMREDESFSNPLDAVDAAFKSPQNTADVVEQAISAYRVQISANFKVPCSPPLRALLSNLKTPDVYVLSFRIPVCAHMHVAAVFIAMFFGSWSLNVTGPGAL
jgi:hypothetical protein